MQAAHTATAAESAKKAAGRGSATEVRTTGATTAAAATLASTAAASAVAVAAEEQTVVLEAKGGAKAAVNGGHYRKLCTLFARHGPATSGGGRALTGLERRQQRDAAILAVLQR
jgi:hypothetical protein